MAQAIHNAHAVIVLPPGKCGLVGRQHHRKWLSRGRIRSAEVAEEMLCRVLAAIGHPDPAGGLAALRFWGQTSERSGAWMAAADPVHLEARLDHLRLHAFEEDDVSRTDLRELFDYLQSTLGDDDQYAFARLGRLGYLRGSEPIATARLSPGAIHGRAPDEFMPAGDDAVTHDKFLGELQLALHDHEMNQQRTAGGRPAINSIWFWGGGTAPEKDARLIPPLIADEPLFRGYWESCTGVIESWKGNFDECLNVAPDGFVAVTPFDVDYSQSAAIAAYLENLRLILKRGDLRKLTLLFRDGLKIELQKSNAMRFWRRVSPLLMEPPEHD